jgi:glycosyltransferase involved in cell wall biosynthesis
LTVVHVNYAFDRRLRSADELLDRYHTLTGWSRAVRDAGAAVVVVQAFWRDATLVRDGIRYELRAIPRSRSQRVGPLHEAVLRCAGDVVHVNGFDSPVQGWRLRRLLPATAALVIQDHGSAPPAPGSPKALLRRLLMRSIDGCLFTSRAQAQPWLDAGVIADVQVHDVLEASTRFVPIDRRTARTVTATTGDPALLWVGRLDANKDPLTVLDAVERTLHVAPETTMSMLFTEAPLHDAVVRRIAMSERLRRAVRLVGRVPYDEMPAWFSAADLFVLGSRREASGYAAIEACACGCLPVLTGIPSFRAISGNGVGWHWAAGDSADCARALIAAASSDRTHGRSRLLRHFDAHLSWCAVGRRATDIYRSVIERRRTPERHVTPA